MKQWIVGKKLTDWLALGSIIAAVGILYSPVVTQCYAMRDDYAVLWVLRWGPPETFELFSALGRPLAQWLSVWAYSYVDHTCDLWLLRAGALVSAAVLAGFWYYSLRHVGWFPEEAFLLTIIMAALPSVTLFIAWSITFNYFLALGLGFIAGTQVKQRFRCGQPWRYLLAFVLLMASLAIYQPAAMAYWLPLALTATAPSSKAKLPNLKQLTGTVALFIITLAIYYLLHKLHLSYLLASYPEIVGNEASRGNLVQDLDGKLAFFVRSLLVSGSFGHYQETYWISIPILIIILAGILTLILRNKPLQAIILLALPGAIYLPSLIVNENLLKIRLLALLAILLILYFFWSLNTLLPRFRTFRLLIAIALFAYCIYHHHANLNQAIIALQQRERATISQYITDDSSFKAEQILVVQPSEADTATGSRFIEFGTPTSVLSQRFLEVMIQVIYSETHSTDRQITVEILPAEQSTNREATNHTLENAVIFIDLAEELNK